jgi:hypothetical protein
MNGQLIAPLHIYLGKDQGEMHTAGQAIKRYQGRNNIGHVYVIDVCPLAPDRSKLVF